MMTTTAASFAPPRGMRDFYPEDMALRQRIFDAWRQAAAAFAFEPYDACVVESLDLLKRKAGEEIVDQIYAFQDKSGRDLALRAEMTPTLARMVAARQGALTFPLKWYAIAQCFRYERMTLGRKREHYQWNLDIVGEPSVAAEVEVLTCAARALALLGLGAEHYRIRFSSRALLAELLARAGIPPPQHPAVFMALDKRGKTTPAEIETLLRQAGLDAAAVRSAFALLDISTLDQALAAAGGATPVGETLRRFLTYAEACELAPLLSFDISVIRGLSYYTGIVFEAFDCQRRFRAILGGGRYDNLMGEIGGKPATGVGLGFGDVVIAELLQSLGLSRAAEPTVDLAIGFMQEEQRSAALRLAAAERRAGRRVDLALAPEKARKFFSRVGRGQCREAVYLGPDDLAAGAARVKNLTRHTERQIPLPPAAPA